MAVAEMRDDGRSIIVCLFGSKTMNGVAFNLDGQALAMVEMLLEGYPASLPLNSCFLHAAICATRRQLVVIQSARPFASYSAVAERGWFGAKYTAIVKTGCPIFGYTSDPTLPERKIS